MVTSEATTSVLIVWCAVAHRLAFARHASSRQYTRRWFSKGVLAALPFLFVQMSVASSIVARLVRTSHLLGWDASSRWQQRS